VVKLVDAVDSKSTGLCARAGSIPAFGTNIIRRKTDRIALFAMIFYGKVEVCAYLVGFFTLPIRLYEKMQYQ
ncbi:MAG: hypothetical protein U1B83_01160, partial [Candidatus Cloacimonadaceae bacterium]|nr:hypothetical protein [Candidatus Cloacimonadaceae bacterium]